MKTLLCMGAGAARLGPGKFAANKQIPWKEDRNAAEKACQQVACSLGRCAARYTYAPEKVCAPRPPPPPPPPPSSAPMLVSAQPSNTQHPAPRRPFSSLRAFSYASSLFLVDLSCPCSLVLRAVKCEGVKAEYNQCIADFHAAAQAGQATVVATAPSPVAGS